MLNRFRKSGSIGAPHNQHIKSHLKPNLHHNIAVGLYPNKHLSLVHGGTLSEADFSAALRRSMPGWRSELGLKETAGVKEVAEAVAARICEAIKSAQSGHLDLPETKRCICEAGTVGNLALLEGQSLNGVSLDRLHKLASNPTFWRDRIVGEVRLYLSDLRPREDTKAVFACLLGEPKRAEAITGLDGYRWVAELFCQGSMMKAYQLMSSVCKAEGVDFKKLGWGGCFNGTTKQFRKLREDVRVGFNDLSNYAYSGLAGYESFANTQCQGSMIKAYLLMSSVCKAEGIDFKKLGWGAQFNGTTQQFRKLREEIRAGFNDLPSFQFTGQSGYLRFSDTFCHGRMLKASFIMRAICRAEGCKFFKLGWGPQFRGTTEEFRGAAGLEG